MGRPKKYATAEDEEAQRERRRVASREHMRRLRSDPVYCAEVAARKRQRRAEVREYLARNVEYQRTLGSMLLELTPAAEHVPPHLVRKGNSLTQCKVPVVSKSSQADFKPRSRSVGVQAQQGKKIPAKLQVTRDRKALQSYSAKPLHTEYYPKVTQHRGLKVRYGGKVQQLKGYLQPNAQHLKQLTSLSGFGKSSSPGIRIPLLDLSDALSGTLLP
ncbi:uncharacterized protein LOC144145874 isoform X3 [Haemaphysalis longicornis]